MKTTISIICCFLTLMGFAQGNYTVTSLSDDGSSGTLRYGIQSTTASTIDFDSGLAGTLTLTSHLPSITRNITITGNGVNNLTMSGANLYNMFQVSGGVVLTISNITFTANASSNGSIFRADNNNSSVVATSINLTGNRRNYAFYTNSHSTITISNSAFNNNSGTLFGSDYGSTPNTTSDTETDYTNRITVTGCTFSSNTGTIFYTERYVKIDNCVFNNNSSQIGYFRGVNRYQVLNSTFTNNTGWTLFSFSSWIGDSTPWGENTLSTNNTLFDGNTFTGNTGTIINPGGSYKYDNKTTISNNIFTNNGTNWTGNPIVVSGNTLDNFISSVSHTSANSTITVVMNRAVFNTSSGSGSLEANDFQFSVSGGNATLVSPTPTSITASGNTYVLGINLAGDIYGTETITVNPVINSIFDTSSNIAGTTQKNNSNLLNILDSDADGVANYKDQCPDTLPGKVVEPSTGCDDVTPPNTPANFVALGKTYKIVLNWTANSDDTAGYYIYRGTSSNSLTLVTTINSKNSSSYQNVGLATDVIYYYKIIAYDLAGNQSAASNIISASAIKPNIWDGPNVTFTKISGSDWTLPANQDHLTDNVILTRKNNQGLYNIAKESGYNSLSPTDTEWAMGTTANFAALNFSNWREAMQWCPSCQVNQDFVIHLITDDVYIDVKILTWQEVSGGGFSYQRSTPKIQPTLSNFTPIVKTFHDGSFTVNIPTSNSTGTFSYTSSNPAVATIIGNTVTIIGIGVTTITATQQADSTYSSGVITSTLTINGETVLTSNGQASPTQANYINKNGSIGTNKGLSKYGEIKTTKSN